MTDFRDQNDQFYGNSGYEPQTTTGTVGDGLRARHSSLLFLASRSALVINRRA
jgi:hypothetical protein